MEQPVASPAVADDPMARRNTLVLFAAQALNGAIPPVVISLGALTGYYLLGADKTLATAPVTAYLVGTAVGAIPAATLMRKVGRRAGFIGGSIVATTGGFLAGLSVLQDSFVAFLFSLALLGLAGSFVQQYRFAAADSGSPAQRARAISWVLAGGVLAAVIGPQMVIQTRDLFDPIPFAGSFFSIMALSALGLLVLLALGGDARHPPKDQRKSGGRPLGEIARQPQFIVAVICAIGSYALMSLVMTAAPLAMVDCGLGQDNAALGIQWHVLAMFAPSFVTGSLIARFGKETIVAAGMLLLAACAVVALSGIELAHFWIALILLGVGWNFGFIGATAMLTDTYTSEERSRVQGLNDLLVFGSVALASLSSGTLFATLGWDWINWLSLPAVALCLAVLAVGRVMRGRLAA